MIITKNTITELKNNRVKKIETNKITFENGDIVIKHENGMLTLTSPGIDFNFTINESELVETHSLTNEQLLEIKTALEVN